MLTRCSELIDEFVDCISASLALLREAFRKLTAITLPLVLEREQVGQSNATVATDSM